MVVDVCQLPTTYEEYFELLGVNTDFRADGVAPAESLEAAKERSLGGHRGVPLLIEYLLELHKVWEQSGNQYGVQS